MDPLQDIPKSETIGPKESFWSRYKASIWTGLIAVGLVTLALLTYVLYVRNPERKEQASDIRLEIEAPEASASGSEISYKVKIENLSNSKITKAELEAFYPSGFTFIDSVPDVEAANDGRKFSIPELPAHGQEAVVIVGRLEGTFQEVKVISFKLHYIPENFRSTFVAEASAQTRLLAPDLSLRLVAPAQLVSGQKIIYELRIKNISPGPFPKARVQMTYPEKFEPENSQSPQWDIENLGAGETRNIQVAGIVRISPGREAFAEAELLIPDGSGNMVSAGRSFAFTQITSSPLQISHRLATASPEVLPGQVLHFEVNYQNTSAVALNNVVIEVIFSEPTVDLNKQNSTSGQIQGSGIVWIPAVAPQLLVVGPGELGKFDLRVPVSERVITQAQKNPVVASRVQFHSKELLEPIVGNSLEHKIESVLEVEATATAMGGKAYLIDLTVKNGVNDTIDTVLTAIVPTVGAELITDSVIPPDEQTNVKFIPNAGIVRWDLGRVFAFSGSFHDSRKLSFILYLPDLNPDSNQSPSLISEIVVTGTDEFTGNKITSKKIDNLTAR
ncbi:MAG: hypothetical protein Q8R08_04805 [bacterium]|nr:hypothetical protein [bacterium]